MTVNRGASDVRILVVLGGLCSDPIRRDGLVQLVCLRP